MKCKLKARKKIDLTTTVRININTTCSVWLMSHGIGVWSWESAVVFQGMNVSLTKLGGKGGIGIDFEQLLF